MGLPQSFEVVEYLSLVQKFIIDLENFQGPLSKQLWTNRGTRAWTHTVFVECAKRLTGTTSIGLRRLDLTQPQYKLSSLPGPGGVWHTVTTLDLEACTFKDIHELHIFVTSFQALSSLQMETIRLQSKNLLSFIPQGSRPLNSLRFWCEYDVMIPVVKWLVSTGMVRHLVHLNWSHWKQGRWDDLIGGIEGSSLKELVFLADYNWQGWSICCSTCFCRC